MPTSASSDRSVLFLNRCYWPDAEATGQLLTDLCEYLSARWRVSVLTGQPNRNVNGERFVAVGDEVRNRVTIHRLGHTTFPKRNKFGRLANLTTFGYQTRRWARRTNARFDLVVAETDPFFLPVLATGVARRVNAKWIAYVQDIYPDVAVGLGAVREGWITGRIRAQLRSAYELAHRIIVLDEDMRDRLADWGIPRHKLRIVPNWIDCEAVYPVKQDNRFRQRHGLEGKFLVVHSGNMGMSQRLEDLIDATFDPCWPDEAVIALIGDGARKQALVEHAKKYRAGRVMFFDYQPREELATSLSAADLQVVSMDAGIRGCLAPSKLYGILASGTATLVIGPENCAPARLVREGELGRAIMQGSPKAIAESIRWACEHPEQIAAMGQRAREAALKDYDRKVCCAQFEQILDES